MTALALEWLKARAACAPLPALDCESAIAAHDTLKRAGEREPWIPFESVTKWCNATCKRGMAAHVRRNS